MDKIELREITRSVDDDLALSRSDLDKQMIHQPQLYAYYALALAKAMRDERRVKIKQEMLESKIYRLLQNKHSRVTEKMLVSECHRDEMWLRLRKLIDDAEYIVDVLKGITIALIHKKDMLVNLGATVRTEMERLSIRTKGESYEH